MFKSDNLRKHRNSNAMHYYVITIVTYQRVSYFNDLVTNRKLIQELQKLDEENATHTICFVIMPDHIHWQFQLLNKFNLAETVKRFKGRTSTNFRNQNITQKLWQNDYYEHKIRNEKDLIQQARYIIANPLRANLVRSVSEYPYWDSIYL